MAKAALNMMTRTAATDYHADGIHMNSVDTGWVTDEDTVEIAAQKNRRAALSTRRFDIVDGAAAHPRSIIDGLTPANTYGDNFLKDYRPAELVKRRPFKSA